MEAPPRAAACTKFGGNTTCSSTGWPISKENPRTKAFFSGGGALGVTPAIDQGTEVVDVFTGFIVLSQKPTLLELFAISLVVIASVGVTRTAPPLPAEAAIEA
jgi:hypothetical protein